MQHISSLARKLGEPSKSVDMTQGGICRTILAFALPIMIGNLFQAALQHRHVGCGGRQGGGIAQEGARGRGRGVFPVTPLLPRPADRHDQRHVRRDRPLLRRRRRSPDEARHRHRRVAHRRNRHCGHGCRRAALPGAVRAHQHAGGHLGRRRSNTPRSSVSWAPWRRRPTTTRPTSCRRVRQQRGAAAVPDRGVPAQTSGWTMLFVFPLGWGVAGAAIATVLSQLISAILCLAYMARRVPRVRLARSDWKWDGALAAEHLRTGVPMAFFSSLLGHQLPDPAIGAELAGAARTSRPTPRRARWTRWSIRSWPRSARRSPPLPRKTTGSGSIGRIRKRRRPPLHPASRWHVAGLTAFTQLFGRFFMLLFVRTRKTSAILASGIMYMRTTSVLYVVLGFNYVIRFALIGVGKSAIPMLVGLSEIAAPRPSPTCWSTALASRAWRLQAPPAGSPPRSSAASATRR